MFLLWLHNCVRWEARRRTTILQRYLPAARPRHTCGRSPFRDRVEHDGGRSPRRAMSPVRAPGPVDVHKAHQVWSALFFTSWSSEPHVCCRSCGIKKQSGSLLFSVLLGWWGFPWGLIMTPVQISRNIIAMAKAPHPLRPSPDLEQAVRLNIAARLLEEQQLEQSTTPQ